MTAALAVPEQTHHFRRCVGEFPTGVTVVCARHDAATAGMTLNSFTSVSLDPLLVLVSLAHGSRTLAAVEGSRRFSVSILAAGQRAVAEAFARPGGHFPAEHVTEDDDDVLVTGALAHLRCDVVQLVRAGDHDLVLGAARSFERRDAEPLVFHQGAFGALRRVS